MEETVFAGFAFLSETRINIARGKTGIYPSCLEAAHKDLRISVAGLSFFIQFKISLILVCQVIFDSDVDIFILCYGTQNLIEYFFFFFLTRFVYHISSIGRRSTAGLLPGRGKNPGSPVTLF